MSLYDVHIKDFPRIPSHMILDENGRITGPLFTPISDHPSRRYDWSEDNTVELAKGWIKQAPTLEELARTIGVPEDNLTATVARWNEICERQEDTDFRRFAGSLFPIFKPPFYAVEVWPVITNTQGGAGPRPGPARAGHLRESHPRPLLRRARWGACSATST